MGFAALNPSYGLRACESRDPPIDASGPGQWVPAFAGTAVEVVAWLMRDQPAFDGGGLDRLLQLLEGAHLDLTHPLARDAVLLRQIFEGRRVFLQPALGQDMALAIVEVGHRLFEQIAPQPQLLAFAEHGFLALAVVDQPILPFALAVAPQRRI